MAVSTSSLESIAGNLLFRCGLCQESDMTLQEGFLHCQRGHSRDQTEANNIPCADCSVEFPCKAFFMLPRLHNPGCRMPPDESSRSVSGTTSGSILLFDAEEIQDVQSVANPSRTLPDTTVLQLGDSASLAEDGGVSASLFPTSASFQASLQAEASAQVSNGSAEKIQDVPSAANPSRNLPDTTVLQFGDPASLAEDGGVSAYLFPTSASFQASLQAEASAQVSSGSVLCAYATDESAAQGPETASVAARSVNAENTDLKRMYRCSTCGLSFIGIYGITTHTRKSACGSLEKCRLCDFLCETYEDLDKHGKLVHKGKDDYIYMCPLCNKGYKKRKGLTDHHRVHRR